MEVLSQNSRMLALGLIIISLFSFNSVNAAMVTQNGTNVSFTYDDSTLFGAGTVVGNAIFFSPTNFFSETTGDSNPLHVWDTLNIVVESIGSNPFNLDQIGVFESGDYILDGPGASASVSIRTQATSLTTNDSFGVPYTNTVLTQSGDITSPNDGSTNLWNLNNINDWAWTDTKILFQIQNNLIADSDAENELAFIQKKSGAIGIVVNSDTNPIPVPAAVWLMGSALLGLCGFRKR